MTDTQTEVRLPAHQRLHTFSTKHLVRMLRKCQLAKGETGFDPYRHDQCKSKDGLVKWLLDHYTHQELDAAHDAARQEYKGGFAGRSRRRSSGEQRNPEQYEQGNGNAKAEGSTSTDKADEAETDGDEAEATDEAEAYQPEFKPEADKADEAEAKPDAALDAFQQMIAKIVAQQVAQQTKAMRAEMSKLAAELGRAAAGGTTRVELKRPDIPETAKLGLQHKCFPLLLQTCATLDPEGNRMNVWLNGPPGSGKTRAAKEVAKALGLAFYFNGSIQETYKLTGYQDANGKYHTTAFRAAWEHGGIYLFDEIDASNPNAVVELNAALSTGEYTFPDQALPIVRHKDCVVIAAANTNGAGGNADFNGRIKQDGASLDRFAMIDWPVDEALERALCPHADWVKRVQSVRRKVAQSGVRGVLITPRASLYGAALLASGISQTDVEAMVLRKGIKDDVWAKIGV